MRKEQSGPSFLPVEDGSFERLVRSQVLMADFYIIVLDDGDANQDKGAVIISWQKLTCMIVCTTYPLGPHVFLNAFPQDSSGFPKTFGYR